MASKKINKMDPAAKKKQLTLTTQNEIIFICYEQGRLDDMTTRTFVKGAVEKGPVTLL